MSSSTSVWSLGGSRDLSQSGQALAAYVAGQLLRSRATLAVGCCRGADAAIIECAAGTGFASRLWVFTAFGPVHTLRGAFAAAGTCSSSAVDAVQTAKAAGRLSCPGPGVARTCPLSRGCAGVPRTSPAPPRRAGLSCRMAPGGRARACWPRPWPGWGSRCTPSRLRLWCRRRRCRGRGPRGLSSGCRAGGCRHRGRLRLRSQLSLSASASTSTKPPFRAVFFARNFRDLGFGN